MRSNPLGNTLFNLDKLIAISITTFCQIACRNFRYYVETLIRFVGSFKLHFELF
jgi:hypothetical protein